VNLSDPQERSAVAAEYILGTLDAADHAAVSAALADDDALRADVYYWQDRLLGLTRAAPPAELPPELWRRIEAGLPPRVASDPLAASPGQRDANAANQPDFWHRLAVWRAIAGAAVAATLVLAIVAGRPPTPEVRYIAVLQAPDKTALAGWIVEATPGGQLRLVPTGAGAAMVVPAGRALQFWTKPEGAAGPTSLGLVAAGASRELPAAQLPGLADQTLFEITLEPETGSPYDRPSGPVLFIGRALRI